MNLRGSIFVFLVGGLSAAPLAERSQPSGDTLFTKLSAEETGIVVPNPYDDPRMWGELYRELTFGAMGTGVAAGDYDNDGRPDLFVVSKTKTSRLFRNTGNWKFVDVTEAAGLAEAEESSLLGGLFGGDDEDELKAWEQGVTWADINNDGWLDLYVCRHAAPNLLYLNQGDGTFVEEAEKRGLAIVDGSGVGAFADYDRDGDLDVYVQTNMMDYAQYPDGRPDYLLRNKGDGIFEDVTQVAGISGMTSGHSVMWGDYNDDGWPDIYVVNDFAPPDQLYRNNGDGTFSNITNAALPSMPFYGMGSDAADVDGNGTFDLFVADMAATTHEKDQRSMAGSRVRGQKHDQDSPEPPSYMRNHLLLNTGTGLFREAAHLAGLSATDWTWSVRWADFDLDGWPDLHVTNGMNREYHGADLLERIMISENPAEPIRIMQDSPVLAEANLAFRNRGGLQFDSVTEEWGLTEVGVSFGAATADFDGDGDLDLVYTNYEGNPSVFRNDAQNGDRLVIKLRGEESNRFGIGAKVTVVAGGRSQIQELQPTRGYLSSGEPMMFFGLGEHDLIERVDVQWPSGRTQTLAEIPANQRLTLEEENADALDSGTLPWGGGQWSEQINQWGLAWPAEASAVLEPNDQPLLPFRFDRVSPQVVAGDYTGDGRTDLVVSGTTASPPRLLVASESGKFSHASAPALSMGDGVPAGPMALFDGDGDGRLDLLVTGTGADTERATEAYQPRYFVNRGGFTDATDRALPELSIRVGAVAAADFDRDGDIDIFVGARLVPGRYPESPASVLLRNDAAVFSDQAEVLALADLGMVTAAVWMDGDGDGWLDLVIANDWGRVRYLQNQAGKTFADKTEQMGFSTGGRGWWRSFAVADFNGDGRPDIAAGNVGLNTPYQASVEEPMGIHLANFGRSRRSRPTLIESYVEDGRLLPRRERKEISAQVRTVARSYRRTIDYAAATLPEIFGDEVLAAATSVEADQLASGVFLSQSDGTWRFAAFPAIAQIAPATRMIALHFDEDDHLDLLLLQNDHSPLEVIGRFGGGLGQVLRGDGAGDFDPVLPRDSGVRITGAVADGVALDVDGDGDQEVFITRVNDSSMLWGE
ncbi:VCBS repeat-containing protein [Opitutaceae bacterium]|nr:VCBS repeat-containing protein [Opitutaceae bacterium]